MGDVRPYPSLSQLPTVGDKKAAISTRTQDNGEPIMKALVYHGPGQKAWEDVPKPTISADTDAIVRVDATTICGTDLHILKGDVPTMVDGRIIGHEAVGTVEEVGTGVKTLNVGDRVLV